MTSAAHVPARHRIITPVLGLAIAAVVLVVAALSLGGHDQVAEPLPEMAASAVQLPGGAMLYVQKFEVTVAEWNRCHADAGCALALHTRAGFDPATTPATGLSHVDASEYIRWKTARTGHAFRLPTRAEWDQMAQSVLRKQADPLFTDPALTWASAYLVEGLTPRALRPQDSFATTPEGIADLDGSVWEWTDECYAGAEDGVAPARCPAYFVGGEHMAAMSFLIRDPARGGCAVGVPPAHLGMRLVSDDPL